jgi:hypothetical protein
VRVGTELAGERIEAVRKRFSVRVSPTRVVSVAVRGRTGTGSGKVLRAPEAPGTYALYVTVGDRADRAIVVASEPPAEP